VAEDSLPGKLSRRVTLFLPSDPLQTSVLCWETLRSLSRCGEVAVQQQQTLGLAGMPGDPWGGRSWEHPSCALSWLRAGGYGRPLWHSPASAAGSRLSCGSGEGWLQGQETRLRPEAFAVLSFKAASLHPGVPCVRKHSGTQGKTFCPGSHARMCEPRACWRRAALRDE